MCKYILLSNLVENNFPEPIYVLSQTPEKGIITTGDFVTTFYCAIAFDSVWRAVSLCNLYAHLDRASTNIATPAGEM